MNLKSYSIFTFKKLFKTFFTIFYSKKIFAAEKNVNKLTNERKRNLLHIKGLGLAKEPKSLKN